MEQVKEELAAAKKQRKAHDASTETEDMAGEGGVLEEGREDGAEARPEAGEGGEAAGETDADVEAAAQPTEDEIRQEMATMFDPSDNEEETLIAITMFCVLEEYEAQVGSRGMGWPGCLCSCSSRCH